MEWYHTIHTCRTHGRTVNLAWSSHHPYPLAVVRGGMVPPVCPSSSSGFALFPA